MKKLKSLAVVMCLMIASVCLVACGNNLKLELSTVNGVLTAKPGETVQFETKITSNKEEDESKTVAYEITKGDSQATISASGLLTVNQTAVPGEEIVVVSKLNKVKSNEVKIVVASIPLQSIEISSNKTNVVKGGFANLSAVLTPANTTESDYEWVVVEGQSSCEIVNNKLMINEDAQTGSTIKIKAVKGSKESNVLTITVAATSSEILFLSFVNETITLDSKDTAQNQNLQVQLFNGDGQQVTNKEIDFAIEEGEDLIQITPNGYSCSFTILGHGTAKISAQVRGTDVEEIATINVIVPPTAIQLPGVFVERIGYEYNFSKVDQLPFDLDVVGTKVCEDLTVTFEKDGVKETTAGEFATYTNGKIEFKQTGKIKVLVSSNSGSKTETTTSYTFNVNEGINVYTFEQLKTTLENANYNGETVNVVVLEKPTTNSYSYSFGYDLVPAESLKAKSAQNIDSIRNGVASIYTTKSVNLNGNNHTIDGSNLRVITKAEAEEKNWGAGYRVSSLLEVRGTSTYNVSINDLTMKGNCPVNFGSAEYGGDLNGEKAVGVYARGLEIGGSGDNVVCYATIKNVKLSGFNVGLRINHAVNSLVEKMTVENCYSNGIESSANIITFKDMTYGLCGAAGIELTPDSCKNAGTGFNQNQTVSYAGTITTTNYNNGDTVYMQNYNGGIVTQVLAGNLAGKSNEVISNIMNADQQFVFISFIFNDIAGGLGGINSTVLDYTNADANGIIDLKDVTGVDTTHQYITLDVIIPKVVAETMGMPAAAGASMGKVLLYNLNYVE